MSRITLREKKRLILEYYDCLLIGTVVRRHHPDNKIFKNLLDSWLKEKGATFYESNNCILLINLLYNIVKNASDNKR